MEKIKKQLIKKCGYSKYVASITAQDLHNMKYDDLREALSKWMQGASLPIVNVENNSTETLMDVYGMSYPAALVFIDWYRDDPTSAIKSLTKM